MRLRVVFHVTSDTCPDCGETTPPEDTLTDIDLRGNEPAATILCGYRCGTCGAMWETAWWTPQARAAE